MKLKNIIRTTLLSALTAVGFASCESDIDKVYVLPSDEQIVLGGATGDIILSADNTEALVMTLYWNGDGQLSLSDTLLQAPVNAAEETIQLSADEAFTTAVDVSMDKGVRYRQFLCGEFNSLLTRLGYADGVLSPLYIRVRSVLANNQTPTYSQTMKVNVQPYRIYLIYGTVLDKSYGETGMSLASPDEDGIYRGFLGVGGWYNWYMREANNIVWGNVGKDNSTFLASSDDSKWNFWFPSLTGCYYTTVNTTGTKPCWTALYVNNLTVAGDLSGEMTYNQKANQWTLEVNLTVASTLLVTISGAGSLYDNSTTDAGPAKDQTVAFGGTSDKLTFGETGSTISVDMPAGKSYLVLDLSNPLAWTLQSGEAPQDETVGTQLFFSGLVDWSGFSDYLTLYDESTKAYCGAHYIKSEWGYRAYPEEDWNKAYKGGDGATGTSGALVYTTENDGNIPAPEEGLYLMDFKLDALTYSLTKITSVSYAGLNDDWSMKPMTQSADNKEVFTAEFVKTANTPWGVKVYFNDSWDLYFGGGNGTLKLWKDGFDGDNELTVGETYILTVDLGKQTYTYSLK